MFINKYLIKPLAFLVLAVLTFASTASISIVELNEKFEANLTIEEINSYVSPISLLLKLELHNLTEQTLSFQHKKIESMMTIFVYNQHGSTINRNEIRAKIKRRGEKVFEFISKPEQTTTFSRTYDLQDYFKADSDYKEVYIQAHIRLTQSNNGQLLIGRLKSNKIKVTPDMLAQ